MFFLRSKKIKFLAVFLSLVLAFLLNLGAETVFAASYQANGKTYDLISGTFKFPSTVKVNDSYPDLSARFFYSDGFFAEDPTKYNPHIATASLCMAMASFNSNLGARGNNVSYSNKSRNIVEYMRNIGVAEKDIFRNFYTMVRPQADGIGVTIGKKATADNRTLLIISIRGINYEKEWASNVTIGTTGEVEGFSRGADIAIDTIKYYITDKKLESNIASGDVDFWIAGYSRGGVAANLAARRLVDEYSSNGNKIFAYCFEAPHGGLLSSTNSKYTCIHSVINKNDIITYVAPTAMKFQRYGIDHYVPGSDADYKSGNSDNTFYQDLSSQEYINMKNKMLTQLNAVNPAMKFSDDFSSYGFNPEMANIVTTKWITTGSSLRMNDFLDGFCDRLVEWCSIDRPYYVANVQPALRDIMLVSVESTNAEVKEFKDRIANLGNIQDLCEAIRDVVLTFSKWDKIDFEYKKQTLNKIVRWLDSTKCFDALNLTDAEKERMLKIDLPPFLDFVMTFLSVDSRNELYDTAGLTQILTLAMNISNIKMNHYPETNFAWLRAHDSFYDNETTSVSSSLTAVSEFSENVKAADDNASIIYVTDIPDIFVDHGTLPTTSLLSNEVMGGTIDGGIKNLSITWDSNYELYAPSETLSGSLWNKVTDKQTALKGSNPLLAVFKGKITGAKLEGVSPDVKANIYIAGSLRLNPPYASLPDGEYSGAQTVSLNFANDDSENSIMYYVSEIIVNADGSISGEASSPVPYNGKITIGEESPSQSKEYVLVAYIESTNKNVSANSEEMIWYYKINPLKSENINSENVSNTISKTYTLSKDVSVYWKLSSDITFSVSELSKDPADLIYVDIMPGNTDEVAVKKVDLTVVSIEGITRKGVYKIPVLTSTSKDDWTNAEIQTIEFNTSEVTDSEKKTNVRSSGGGCNVVLTIFGWGIALFALIMKYKES